MGWQRKIIRRIKEEKPFYRSAESILKLRCKKKLLEKVTWYKNKRKREDDADMPRKTGLKLEDLLHKADPWQGQDCVRNKCLMCLTKQKAEKQESSLSRTATGAWSTRPGA